MQPIGEFVRKLMPEESAEEELRDAQRNIDELMEVLIRIYHRLEAEGTFNRKRE